MTGSDRTVLRDLEQRLADKALTLSDMADATSNGDERTRLRGKAEGVDLALSFVQEALREPPAASGPLGKDRER